MSRREESRRSFVKSSLLAGAGLAAASHGLMAMQPQQADTSAANWQKVWQSALATLAGNVRTMPRFADPVLVEGSTYNGIWQECGPHEALVYASLAEYVSPRADKVTPVELAKNNHRAFFALQHEDGQLPDAVKASGLGYSQLQMVVPIASTAWDVAQISHDEAFLSQAYQACSRWDAWLRRYRDTRKTGLVEAFCVYDTGQDNSPRWAGVPKQALHGDARYCPPAPGMPRLCPDLSASVYGGRVALAKMAEALGKKDEADRWRHDAETIRGLIITKLYDPEDASFYDLDTNNKFVRVRSVANLRILANHVLDVKQARDRRIFDDMWTRQLHNPKAYWTPYPFPSIAINDPVFVRPIPRNSWGGASQALTALRTLRWMDHYGKSAEQDHVAQQWCEAILRHGEFRQQMDPLTGVFTQPDPGGYSPAALAFLSFAKRLGKAPKA